MAARQGAGRTDAPGGGRISHVAAITPVVDAAAMARQTGAPKRAIISPASAGPPTRVRLKRAELKAIAWARRSGGTRSLMNGCHAGQTTAWLNPITSEQSR